MFPTTPKINIVVAIVAAKNACTANNTGAINKNVNSNGSVIPEIIAVNTTGINNPAVNFFFSGFAVAYIANAIPIAPNIFEFPCNANPPAGNNCFNGCVLAANS